MGESFRANSGKATFTPRTGKASGGSARYEFHPAGWDVYDPRPHHPLPGTHVVLSMQSGVGTRPPGGMGKDYRYVEHADTGDFYGMVHKDSLRRVTRGGTASGPTTAPEPPMFRDRRAG